ncbi:MAG: hypothetical protein HYY05_04640, partial [Chloroflexi bacterium]|nr:hypothetical protein [Chloroflexota bacterium]
KDWAIAEGWTEGPRKLQGYRALDVVHRRIAWQRLAGELRTFLVQPAAPDSLVLSGAHARARAILDQLGQPM